MRIDRIFAEQGIETATARPPSGEVERGFIGDLLSYVVGNAPEKALWITVHGHLNAAAVAVLREIPCIVLVGGRRPDKNLLERCNREGIVVGVTELSAFELAGRLWSMGLGGGGSQG
ncbi:MAG: serine kinase [Synergistales bacterium]|nr:serine kinase [Synergistales bacterium]